MPYSTGWRKAIACDGTGQELLIGRLGNDTTMINSGDLIAFNKGEDRIRFPQVPAATNLLDQASPVCGSVVQEER